MQSRTNHCERTDIVLVGDEFIDELLEARHKVLLDLFDVSHHLRAHRRFKYVLCPASTAKRHTYMRERERDTYIDGKRCYLLFLLDLERFRVVLVMVNVLLKFVREDEAAAMRRMPNMTRTRGSEW